MFNTTPTGKDLLAQAIAQGGQQRGPEHHWAQGLGRMASVLSSAYIKNQANDQRTGMMQKALSDANAQQDPTARMQALATALLQANDPAMAKQGLDMTMQGWQGEATAAREDKRDDKKFGQQKEMADIQNQFQIERQAADRTFQKEMFGARTGAEEAQIKMRHEMALAEIAVRADKAAALADRTFGRDRAAKIEDRVYEGGEYERRLNLQTQAGIRKAEANAKLDPYKSASDETKFVDNLVEAQSSVFEAKADTFGGDGGSKVINKQAAAAGKTFAREALRKWRQTGQDPRDMPFEIIHNPQTNEYRALDWQTGQHVPILNAPSGVQ